jgi:hypothetical protein
MKNMDNNLRENIQKVEQRIENLEEHTRITNYTLDRKVREAKERMRSIIQKIKKIK